MSEQDNVRVVEKWIEALNSHDVTQFEELRGPGYLFDVPGSPRPVGVDQEIAYTQGMYRAFSDLHVDVQRTIAAGSFVVVSGAMTGTNDGALPMANGQMAPATGKTAVIPFSNTFEVADGKVVRNSVYYDVLGGMVQLGVVPGM